MRLGTLSFLLMLTACGGASSATFVADSANATAGDAVRVRLFVTTVQGGVKVGAKVAFSVTAPAELSVASAETNAQGVAETKVTLNEAGIATVTATVDGQDYTASVHYAGVGPGPVVATKVVFDNAPVNVSGQNLLRDGNGAALRVVLMDDSGHVASESTASVTVALTAGSCTARIDPSQVPLYTTQAAASGVASFGYVRFTQTGTGCTLTATSGSLTTAVSGSFDVTQ
jgi:adhesin/invasin